MVHFVNITPFISPLYRWVNSETADNTTNDDDDEDDDHDDKDDDDGDNEAEEDDNDGGGNTILWNLKLSDRLIKANI